MVLSLFHQLAEPGLATGVLYVGVLDADRAAVGLAQSRQDLTKRLNRTARQVTRDEMLVETLIPESVVRGIELGKVGRLATERITLGNAMAPSPVGMNQTQNPGVLVGLVQERRGVGGRGCKRGVLRRDRTEHTVGQLLREGSRGRDLGWTDHGSAGSRLFCACRGRSLTQGRGGIR
jgi:hypothetical protein